jgi:hypothetical protein
MEGLAVLCAVVMLCFLYWGLWFALEWDREARITGICTAVWAVVALYLFISEWLLFRRHEIYGLLTITMLSSAGYIFGRTLAVVTRREWIEE